MLEAALAVRRPVYVEETGKLTASTLRDEHDDEAFHVVLFRGTRPIAAARVLLDTNPFEMEAVFPTSGFRATGRCMEVSRLCVLPEARAGGATMRILLGILELARSLQARTILAVAVPKLVAFYESLGFRAFAEPTIYPALRQLHVGLSLDVDDPRLEHAVRRYEAVCQRRGHLDSTSCGPKAA